MFSSCNFNEPNNKRRHDGSLIQKLINVTEKTPSYNVITKESIYNRYVMMTKLTEKQIQNVPYYNFSDYSCKEPNHEIFKFTSLEQPLDKFKILLLYEQLNEKQQEIFKKWHSLLSSDSFLYCLDAPAGTGKSFLIKIFMMTCNIPITFTSYRHDLITNMRFYSEIHKFEVFATAFTIKLFNSSIFSNTGQSFHRNSLLSFLCNFPEKTNRIYIVDEYTILPSIYIAHFIVMCKYGTSFIFTGDSFQQHSINKSKNYNISNYNLILKYTKHTDQLVNIMRSIDVEYNEKLSKLKQYIPDTEMEDPIFNYRVYLLFKDKFYQKSSDDDNIVFLAARHKSLKTRFNDKAKKKNVLLFPYKLITKDKISYLSEHAPMMKFPTIIMLSPGMYYIYTYTIGTVLFRDIVKLLQINKGTLKIKNLRTDNIEHITNIVEYKNTMLGSAHLAALYEYFKNKNKATGKLFGFPLQNLSIRTYHSVQGLTFPSELKIECLLDHATTNSIYVGLTRVKDSNQLYKLTSKDLYSFEYSESKNDDYLYYLTNEQQLKYKNTKQLDDTFLEGNINEFKPGYKYNINIQKDKMIIDNLSIVVDFFLQVPSIMLYSEDAKIIKNKESELDSNVDLLAYYKSALDYYMDYSTKNNIFFYDHASILNDYSSF